MKGGLTVHFRLFPNTTANCLPLGNPSDVLSLKGEAETVVVVAVVGRVVVAIRHSHVPRVVVPAAATQNAVTTLFICCRLSLFPVSIPYCKHIVKKKSVA